MSPSSSCPGVPTAPVCYAGGWDRDRPTEVPIERARPLVIGSTSADYWLPWPCLGPRVPAGLGDLRLGQVVAGVGNDGRGAVHREAVLGLGLLTCQHPRCRGAVIGEDGDRRGERNSQRPRRRSASDHESTRSSSLKPPAVIDSADPQAQAGEDTRVGQVGRKAHLYLGTTRAFAWVESPGSPTPRAVRGV